MIRRAFLIMFIFKSSNMKRYLSLIALAAALSLAGCKHSAPEPDFSGLQDIPYTVVQSSVIGGGAARVFIYPNPFFDHLTVGVHNPHREATTIYLSDEKGKYSRKITITPEGGSNQVWFDFSGMPKGVYLCEVQHPDKVDRYRLVKAR